MRLKESLAVQICPARVPSHPIPFKAPCDKSRVWGAGLQAPAKPASNPSLVRFTSPVILFTRYSLDPFFSSPVFTTYAEPKQIQKSEGFMFRGHRRIRLILLLVVIVVVGVLLGRSWIAEIPNSLARQMIRQRTPEDAFAYLDWSEWIAGKTANSEFLRARASRKLARWDEVKLHLARARDLGGDKTLLQREEWLAKAQSGQMQGLQSRRNQMLLDPMGDTEEICEAFVLGYLSIQHFDEAAQLIESWSADYPKNPEPHFLTGLIHGEEQRFASAEESFLKALQISPAHFQARLALANAQMSVGRNKEALTNFQKCAAQRRHPAVDLGIAKCQQALGELEQATATLESGAALFPKDFALRLELGRHLLNDDFQSSYHHLESAVKLQPSSAEAQYLLAQSLSRLGRKTEAEPYLTFVKTANERLAEMNEAMKRVTENPKDIESRLEIGLIQLKYGTEREGLLWLQSVLSLDPQNLAANTALADFYESKSVESAHCAELASYFRKAAESVARP